MQEIDAYGVGEVVASESPDFNKGDLVVGLVGWAEYTVVKGGYFLRKIDSKAFPLSYHASVLGKNVF